MLNSDSDGWSSVIDVNLKGAFYTAKAGLQHIKKRQSAKLLLLGSGIGHKGAKNSSAYACSKAGTWMLTKVLSEELKGDGVAVNEIIPGPVKTSMNPDASGEMWKEPEDVVPLFIFLLSQKENGPTGQSFSLAKA